VVTGDETEFGYVLGILQAWNKGTIDSDDERVINCKSYYGVGSPDDWIRPAWIGGRLAVFAVNDESVNPSTYTIDTNGSISYLPAMQCLVDRKNIGVPAHFSNKGFGDFTPTSIMAKDFARRIYDWATRPQMDSAGCGLIVTGPTGCGKTHLAIAALRKFVDRGLKPRFVDYRVLIQALRKDWDSDPIGEYSDFGALLIDDVGCIKASDAIAEKVSTILAMRQADKRITILTSNLQWPAQWTKLLDDRLIKRLQSSFTVVDGDGLHDYREKQRSDLADYNAATKQMPY
jgi:DNA replication protein DnaC